MSISLGIVLVVGYLVVPHAGKKVSKPQSSQSSNSTSVKPSPDIKTSSNTSPATKGSSVSKSVAVSHPTSEQKRYYLLSAPNDPYYASAWYLQSVNAPAAWATTTGSSSVTVADIDTGFALSHQDLSAHWKLNSGETGGGKETDGIDNDDNGYVDDWRGWDFSRNSYVGDPGDNNPQAGTTAPNGDGTSHGTETAGLIGAVGNNGTGTTAVSQNVSILPLQVIDDTGSGYSDAVANAIYYAVRQGVDVINMSLGTSGNDPIVEQAVDYAHTHDVVVVAAAGNCGNAGATGPCAGQAQGYITFPASYDKVMAVGATDSNSTRASFSSYGPRLDVVAPGSGSIVSPTWVNGNGTTAYATSLYGTSYASPIVASSVALIKSIRPSSTVDDMRALIMADATKLSSMSGSFYSTSYGHGMLNVNQAITVAGDLNATGEVTPTLAQAGGAQSERSFSSSETLGSGCQISSGSWCSVWLRNTGTYNERYLPYTKADISGTLGWSYNSSSLTNGNWEVRARDGSTVSDTPYNLFKK